jgi:hypothetical protein
MSGIEHYNFPAFHKAADAMRSWGHTVLCPADKETKEGTDMPNYHIIAPGLTTTKNKDVFAPIFRRDMEDLLSVEGIVFLPNWQRSLGARLEFQMANALGLLMFEMRYFHGEPGTIQPFDDSMVRVESYIVVGS